MKRFAAILFLLSLCRCSANDGNGYQPNSCTGNTLNTYERDPDPAVGTSHSGQLVQVDCAPGFCITADGESFCAASNVPDPHCTAKPAGYCDGNVAVLCGPHGYRDPTMATIGFDRQTCDGACVEDSKRGAYCVTSTTKDPWCAAKDGDVCAGNQIITCNAGYRVGARDCQDATWSCSEARDVPACAPTVDEGTACDVEGTGSCSPDGKVVNVCIGGHMRGIACHYADTHCVTKVLPSIGTVPSCE